MNVTYRENRFPLPGYELAAKQWGAENGIPTLALHGWLDNAGSFDLLAPLLPELNIVALDSAGHGLSGFRSIDANYTLIEEVEDCLRVADQLGWDKFHLLGHSRGAAIASLFAGTFPERISHLSLIEGISPLPTTTAAVPTDLAKAILEKQKLSGTRGRLFATREEALQARMQGFIKVNAEAAEILARRSLIEDDGNYLWHADARLKGTSEYRFTPELIFPFLQRIEARTLLVLAGHGLLVDQPGLTEFSSQISRLTTVTLEGSHHLHLEGSEQQVASAILDFLQTPS
jgi:pimeloyl-ACP methyl ester carboxylesterase